MQVREIMTPSAELIDANAMIRDAARTMRDQDLGALPVGDNGRLIGMVTDRDIVIRAVAADRGGGTTAVREVMSEGLSTCHGDASVEGAAGLMAEHKLRRVRWSTTTTSSWGSLRSPISHAAARRAPGSLSTFSRTSPSQPRIRRGSDEASARRGRLAAPGLRKGLLR